MKLKKYKQIRVAAILFITAIAAVSIYLNMYLLAVVSTLTGILFLSVARLQTKTTVDEREQTIREKAAQTTYAIFAPTIGIGALLMILPSSGLISVFSKGEFTYLESLGVVFAYLTLFLIVLYAISYIFFSRKYGGGKDEE